MTWKVRIGLAAAFLVLLVPVLSCNNGQDETKPTLDEVLHIGKQYLVNGDGVGASDAFHEALKMAPDNTDAKYGIVLADTLKFTSLLSELLTLVSSLGTSPGDLVPVGGDLTPASSIPIGDLIQSFIGNDVIPGFDETDRYYYELTQVPDLSFTLEGNYILSFEGTQLISFTGDFGQGELHFFGTVNSLLMAVFRIVMAHDLNFDFGVVTNLNLPTDTVPMISAIVDLLQQLLTDPNYPNFLYLDSDGTEQMQDAGLNLGFTFLRLNMMLDAVRARGGDQSAYPIHYDDANANGAWDAGEAIVISGLTTIGPELIDPLHNLAGDLATAFFDTTAFDVDPLASNPFRLSSLLQFIKDAGIADVPVFGYNITIPRGPFFAEPAPDGLRNILFKLIDIWDLIEPLLGSQAA